MPKKTEWREFRSWWDGVPFVVVCDPDQTAATVPALWPSSYPGVDAEELEVLELAGRLASLKPKTPKKH